MTKGATTHATSTVARPAKAKRTPKTDGVVQVQRTVSTRSARIQRARKPATRTQSKPADNTRNTSPRTRRTTKAVVQQAPVTVIGHAGGTDWLGRSGEYETEEFSTRDKVILGAVVVLIFTFGWICGEVL